MTSCLLLNMTEGALDPVPNITKMKDIVTTGINNPYGWACID